MNVKQRILVVDDTPENLKVMGSILETEDWEVCVASSGSQALTMVAEETPDLILLDVMMPGLSGFEVCKQLKASAKSKDIPIIFLTALNQMEDENAGLGLGAVDYISKPFKIELVKMRIQNQLSLSLLRKQLAAHNQSLEQEVSARTKDLEEAHKKLKVLDSSKSLYLTMIAQELSVPANGITGIAQLALLSIDDQEKKSRYQNLLDSHTSRLNQIVANAQKLGDLEQPDSVLALKPINIALIIEAALSKEYKIVSQKNLNFQFVENTLANYIKADPDLISQALSSLIQICSAMAKHSSKLEFQLLSGEEECKLSILFDSEFKLVSDGQSLEAFDSTILMEISHMMSITEFKLSEKIIEVFLGSVTWQQAAIKTVCSIKLKNVSF